MPSNALKRLAAIFFVAGCAIFLLGPFTVFLLSDWRNAAFAELFSPSSKDLPRLAGLFWATLRVMLGTTLLASILGVTVAVAIRRSRGLYRTLLASAFPIPLLIPPEVIAVGWTHLLGKRGLAAAFWKHISGAPQLPFSIYGEAGSACVLALCWFPLVTMTTLVGLRAIGPKSEAARLYAGPWQRLWAIDRPLLLPYLSAGAACVAWLALGDFDVPSVFLRNAYPIEIYASFQSNPEVARALALCVPLLALSACVLLARSLLARGEGAATISDEWSAAAPKAEQNAGGGRGIKVAAGSILALAVVFPLLSLAHQAGSFAIFGAALETAGGARGEIMNSFRSALTAAVLAVLLAAPYALLLLRLRGWQRALLALLAVLPLAIPGTLHGLAWIKVLEGAAFGRWMLAQPWVVSLAGAARFFPFGVFLLASAFSGVNPNLLHAARASGAGVFRTWLRIVLPLVYPGFLAAFAMTFALTASELACAIMLNPIGFATLPVRLSSLLHFGKDELLAALCLIQVFIAIVPYLAAAALLEKTLEAKLG
ncbi:MAG: iron ABC transporter permease [Planctomycetes bacterium]|nr:iron ABC transporter permease [Planctomycetota bacterium]